MNNKPPKLASRCQNSSIEVNDSSATFYLCVLLGKLIPLSLIFLICEMGVKAIPSSWDCWCKFQHRALVHSKYMLNKY